MSAVQDTFVLCFNCGSVTSEKTWEYLKWNYETEDADGGQKLVPVEEGDSDPLMRCPNCQWVHKDDDANPGIMIGTEFEMRTERRRAVPQYRDWWSQIQAFVS